MKRKTIYLLQCIVVILLLACSEDDLQSLQAAFESDLQEVTSEKVLLSKTYLLVNLLNGIGGSKVENQKPQSYLVLMLYIISLEFIRLPCLSDAEKKQTKW